MKSLSGDSLDTQPWYWGDASKSDVANILIEQPEGTFVVRNASTPGEYTLTVKCNGQCRLVRIHVGPDGSCGFSSESLSFPSVVSLIDFHRNCSLRVYNSQLDTVLLHPLPPPRRKSSSTVNSTFPQAHLGTKHTGDWTMVLRIERHQTLYASMKRTMRVYDCILAEIKKAEELNQHLGMALADLTAKCDSIDSVRQMQQTALEDIQENGDTSLATAFEANAALLNQSFSTIEKQRDGLLVRRQKVYDVAEELKADYMVYKDRIIHKITSHNASVAELNKLYTAKSLIVQDAESKINERIQCEDTEMSFCLDKWTLPWDPQQYMSSDSSKEQAVTDLERKRARLVASGVSAVDGLFLIRESTSQKNKLVLSVYHAGRVSHCLIEYCDQGYGFANTGMYFVTIGDFVRFYAHNSLFEHNKEINTNLTIACFPIN